MGFCFFGTVAIAAKRAIEVHGLSRVAVVDFDVHHGNGTQALLWDEPRALFFSSHQMPLWPGSGAPSERGAHGQIVNLPLPPGSDGGHMRQVYRRDVRPRLAAFAPELLLISAGFDAHRADPLAQLEWEADDYAWLTAELLRAGGGRVVSVLEGGYDLDALADCVAAHVGVLAE
jgi:acetoin utilization deacetylase AcuC-like enzyme